MASRSFLFAPGNHARRVEKALTLPADAVILDLEDAVAISEKPATRELVTAAFTRPRSGRLYVRVNAYSTEWCYNDIVSIARPGLDGIILPKVESADQLRSVDWLLANLERDRGLAIGAIDLDADHRNRCRHAATSARSPRPDRARSGWRSAPGTTRSISAWSGRVTRTNCCRLVPPVVMASRAAGIEPPLDTVWADLRDAEGFFTFRRTRRRAGISGQDVHPSRPDRRRQRGVLSDARNNWHGRNRSSPRSRRRRPQGLASIQLEGQFIDYPIVQRARQVVARGIA